MWDKFLRKVSLIDDVSIECGINRALVSLTILPLGQYREIPLPGEKMSIKWYSGASERVEWRDKTQVDIAKRDFGGWRITIELISDDIRKSDFARQEKKVQVGCTRY